MPVFGEAVREWCRMSSLTLQDLVSLASIGSSVVIAVVAVLAGRTLAQYEQHRVMRQGWVEMDSLALSDPDLLQIAESVLNPGHVSSTEQLQKKWFAYIVLNNLATWYELARRRRTANPEYVLHLTEMHLSRM